MTLVLGIDVGTQGARAMVVDLQGNLQAQATSPFPTSAILANESGWFEQNPSSWRDATIAVVSQVVNQLRGEGVPSEAIAALSVTSTSGTLCLVDGAGQPVRDAIMYSDTRSSQVAKRVQSAGAELATKLGILFSASYALSKLAWVQANEPRMLNRARWLLSPTDLVIGWTSGVWGQSDWTNALKWGYDVVDLGWPAFIGDSLGIDTHKLPVVGSPGRPLGHVCQSMAEATGLSTKTLVVAGSTDGTASQLASGACSPGDWNSTLGTTLVLKGVTQELISDPQGRIYSHRHPDGYWLPGGASSAGADSLSTRFAADDLPNLNATALDHSPTDLIVYPLVRKGERFPFANSEAQGFALGDTNDERVRYAAHLEGLAYVERLCFQLLRSLGAQVGDALHVAGGATKSQAGLQIRADVLDAHLLVPALPQGAMGAAILAASNCGFDSVADTARAMVRYAQTVDPRDNMTAAYDAPYARFVAACAERGYVA